MKRGFLFAVTLLHFYLPGYAQNVDIKMQELVNSCKKTARYPDSLRFYGKQLLALGHQNNHELALLEGYFAVGYSHYLRGEFQASTLYYDSALTDSSVFNKHYQPATRILRNLGIAHTRLGNNVAAKACFDRLLLLAQQQRDVKGIAYAHNQLGIHFKTIGQLDSAIAAYKHALMIWDSLGATRNLYTVKTNIGLTYNLMKLYDKGIIFLKKALQDAISSENVIDEAKAYNNLSVAFRASDRLDSADHYLKKAYQIFKNTDYKPEIALYHQNQGNIYLLQNQYDSAQHYLFKSLRMFKELYNPKGIAESYSIIGDMKIAQGAYDLAIQYLDSAINLSIEKKLKFKYDRFYSSLAKAYEEKGDYKNANKFIRFEQRYRDSLFTINSVKTIEEILTKYEVNKKDELIAIKSEGEAFYKSLSFYIMIVMIILIMAILALYYRSKTTQKKIDKQRAEIEQNHLQLIELKSRAVLPLEEITSIKSDGHYLEFYLANKNKPEIDRNRIKEILTDLPPSKFVQIHRSYIVNIQYIKIKYASRVLMMDGRELPVSRTYKEELNLALDRRNS